MVDSRCGILCSEMNCKEQYGFDCKGCANEEKIPWGECSIKICCESKKLEHCGQCDGFPCERLIAFSYHPEHGDNGGRIEQCKNWCKIST